MEEKIRRCRQCGETKDINSFRRYYNRSSGHYRTCKACERINARYKYLSCKDKLSEAEEKEQIAIEDLYMHQESVGLRPPTTRHRSSVMDEVAKQLCAVENLPKLDIPASAPFELTRWLTEDLAGRTPDDNDRLYDVLYEKYRPIIGTSDEMLPIHDNTYRVVLSQILERFDRYEDEYYK